jgi:hypothetical protein
MKKTISKTPAPKTAKVPAKKTAAPAKKKPVVSSEPPVTFVSAKIDIGFGNQLFIRGEGPGLSWDRGLPMECVEADLWAVTIKHATRPVRFKTLVNDLSWNVGEDYVVDPGQSITVLPSY